MKVYFDSNTNAWREPLDDLEDSKSLYLDGYHKSIMDEMKKMTKKNWDCTFLIVGGEGSGKSTFSFICGQYLSDMKLTINNIAEGTQDAIKKLEQLPNGSILIVDEGELLFSSRETMSKEQRQLTQIMKVIRQKNMILILVSPVFFDLSNYIATHRTVGLFRIVTDNKFNRGYWQFWGKKNKAKLYAIGKKKFGSYSYPKPDRRGRFVNYLPPFQEDYMKIKMNSLKEAFTGKEKSDSNTVYKVLAAIAKEPNANSQEIASKLGLSDSWVRNIQAKYRFFLGK